ncbi:cell wall-binding repeat-containing protein [Microbacterium lacus]|uniref:cell wall-binding repeat-containing protein n=1 Tax=Microbacterium lacus TaxID=415217 RepID=UPI00384AA510
MIAPRRAAMALIVALFATLFSAPAHAVAPESGYGAVSGTITRLSQGVVSPVDGWAQLYKLDDQGVPRSAKGARADANGRYRVPVLLAGVYVVALTADKSWGSFWGGDSLETAARITVSDGGEVTGIDGQVEAYAGMTGSVVFRADPGGPLLPQNEAVVTIDQWDEETGRWEVRTPHVGGTISGPTEQWGLRAGTYRFGVMGMDVRVGERWIELPRRFFDDTGYIDQARTFELRAGDVADLGQLVLEPHVIYTERVAGADRFETSALVSQKLVPTGTRAPVVYVANGLSFPDALTAGPAAAKHGGVVLFTTADMLPAVVVAELTRLRPERIVIVGGPAAVSERVRVQIAALAPGDAEVTRLGGADRFATADLVIRDAFQAATKAYVASGLNFPDALSAGAAAASTASPVLLVNGTGALDQRTEALIDDLGVDHVVIAGGPAAVGMQIESDLRAITDVKRIGAAERFETAWLVNLEAFDQPDRVVVASGLNFADALSAVPLAARLRAPLYLSTATCVPWPTRMGTETTSVASSVLIGGPSVLRDMSASAAMQPGYVC